jgi:hypothetical protein
MRDDGSEEGGEGVGLMLKGFWGLEDGKEGGAGRVFTDFTGPGLSSTFILRVMGGSSGTDSRALPVDDFSAEGGPEKRRRRLEYRNKAFGPRTREHLWVRSASTIDLDLDKNLDWNDEQNNELTFPQIHVSAMIQACKFMNKRQSVTGLSHW